MNAKLKGRVIAEAHGVSLRAGGRRAADMLQPTTIFWFLVSGHKDSIFFLLFIEQFCTLILTDPAPSVPRQHRCARPTRLP